MLEHKEIVDVIKTSAHQKIFKIKDPDSGVYYIERIIHHGSYELYHQLSSLKIRIPKIISLKEENDDLIVIEEYIPFCTLETYLEYEEISTQDTYQIILELCDILDVLHHLNPPIIHRDIKPSNIFYSGKHIYLSDFDIARFYSDTKEHDTLVLGSIGYAAPEQYGLSQSNIQSDIYAVGVLFHYLLSGSFPYHKLYQGKETKIIERCIETAPDKRYRDIRDLKRALRSLMGPSPAPASTLNWRHFLPVGLRRYHPLVNVVFLTLSAFSIGLGIAIARDIKPTNTLYGHTIVLSVAYSAIFVITILYWGNYADIFSYSLFHQHRNKFLVIIGRLLTYIIFLLIIVLLVIIAVGFK
ncbi:MAG: protein kinase domain-containing protein [bacterium]